MLHAEGLSQAKQDYIGSLTTNLGPCRETRSLMNDLPNLGFWIVFKILFDSVAGTEAREHGEGRPPTLLAMGVIA